MADRPDGPLHAVLQLRLDGIAQAMQETLFRCAVSPVVREGNDAAAALLAPNGELLALSDAIPLLLGALDGATRAILAAHPIATMRPGDLFVLNDPFAGGTHLPDLTVVAPVFRDGVVVALAATILHHQDVGGMRAGSVPPDALEIFQEGLRLPAMRLGTAGAIDPAMRALIAANSRAPETVLGDLGAQIAAANRAALALDRLVGETDAQAFLAACAACLDLAEARTRAFIDTLPRGLFEGADGLDPAPGLPDIEIRVALRARDGRLWVDFAGTSAQVAGPVNCVRSGPVAAVVHSLLCLVPPDTPRNGGMLRVIDLALPESCVVNASPPAAVNARMGVVRAATSAVLQALARAAPDRMPAANSGMSFVIVFSRRDALGRLSVATEIVAGGAGGGPSADGAAAISTDVGNAMNMPAEALEAIVPVRLLASRIRRGSGGAGRHRGGDGIQRVYEALADDVSVSLRGERFRRVPPGLAGGGSPAPATAHVERADGGVEPLTARSAFVLGRGDRLVVESCGGAGYGAPSNPEADSP